MRIALLTELTVEDDGDPVDLGEYGRRRRRLRALLCVLALADRPLTAADLREHLWGRGGPDRTSALTNLLGQARSILPDRRLVTTVGPGGARRYALRLDHRDTVDATEFTAAAEAGDRNIDKGRPDAATEHYGRAVELWQDVPERSALRDLPDTEDGHRYRDPLLTLRRRVTEAYVSTQLDLGRHSLELADRVGGFLRTDPANETLHMQRMIVLHRLGRRTDALRAYRNAERALRRELDVGPGAELRRAAMIVEAGIPQARPQPAAPVPPSAAISYRGVTDYTLGGKDNTVAERALVDRLVAETRTDTIKLPAENRACMTRMVQAIAARGIRQFLDLGAGLPVQGSPDLHDAASGVLGVAPRVVYVDNDPIVAVTARALMATQPGTSFHALDFQDVDAVVRAAARDLDLDEPVAVVAVNALQYVGRVDDDLGTGPVVDMMRRYVDVLPPNSCVALTHLSGDGLDPQLRPVLDSRNPDAVLPQHLRSHQQIQRLFCELPLLPPGLTDVGNWRPTEPHVPRPMRILGGLAVKPAP